MERQRRRRRLPSASSTGRSAGKGRPLPAPDDRLRAITPLARSWSRGSDAWPSQMQARQRNPIRHQSAHRRVVRSPSDRPPPARHSRRGRCDKLSRVPHRIDRASECSRACAGPSGQRGWYVAANPSLATICRPSPLRLLEATGSPSPTSCRPVAREASRTPGHFPQQMLRPRFDSTRRALAIDLPLEANALHNRQDSRPPPD